MDREEKISSKKKVTRKEYVSIKVGPELVKCEKGERF